MNNGIRKLERLTRNNQKNVSFRELDMLCRHYFGVPTIRGSHHRFKTPWDGDPRINIQNRKGKVEQYQVKQVIKAIDRLVQNGKENENT